MCDDPRAQHLRVADVLVIVFIFRETSLSYFVEYANGAAWSL